MTSQRNGFLRRRLDPLPWYGLRASLFGVALTLVAVPFTYLLDQVVRERGVVRLDLSAARSIRAALSDAPLLVSALRVITFLGSPAVLAAVVLFCSVALWRARRLRALFFLVVTWAGGILLSFTVKALVGRARPDAAHALDIAHGGSFPSGHVMASTVVLSALLIVFAPKLTSLRRGMAIAGVVAFVLLVAVSRLALGVHYLSDVIAGCILGIAWVATSSAAFAIWRERYERNSDPIVARGPL